MNQIIKETKNYILAVGKTRSSEYLSYQIVNIKHRVIEVETFLLPQALKHMADLEAALQAQLDIMGE